MNIEQFAGHCKVDLKDGVLTASCVVCLPDGRCLKLHRSVDTRPLVDYVARKLAQWHADQHGGAAVSGWSDFVSKAVNAVEDIAKNKTVQSLYQKAAPYLEKAVRAKVPDGDAMMDTATKAHDLYNKAKADHPDAVNAIKSLVGLATQGDPKAQYAVNVMKQVSAMTQARESGSDPNQASTALVAQTNPRAARELSSFFGFGHSSGHSYYDMGLSVVAGDSVGFNMGPLKFSPPPTRRLDVSRPGGLFGNLRINPPAPAPAQDDTYDDGGDYDDADVSGWMDAPVQRRGVPVSRDHRTPGSAPLPARPPMPASAYAADLPPPPPPDQGPGPGGPGPGGPGDYDDQGYDDDGDDGGDDAQVSGWWHRLANKVTSHVPSILKNPTVWKVMFPVMSPEAQKYAFAKYFGPKGPGMVDKFYGILDDAKNGHVPSMQKVAELATQAAAGNEKAKILMASIHNDPAQVSGWGYHRPYQSTAARMSTLDQHPGFGLAAREVYNRGLGRSATGLTDLASQFLNRF